MPTECSPTLFEFAPAAGRAVVAGFDGGAITSDAGALLLGATDRAIGLVTRFATCFADARDPDRIEHAIATLVGQRVFGIALGYEDLIDHDRLRRDPALAILAGKPAARRAACAPLAGKSTLNRLERAPAGGPGRYHRIGHDGTAIEALFVDLFLDAHRSAPRQIILDLDATDVPLHGHQEGRFFRGYYDAYCYLPLYVFCGRHLLAAKLRRSDIDASAGAVEEVARVVGRIRARWPRLRILLRADSGFAREASMAWCEANRVDFVFGLARNPRLVEELAIDLAWAEDDAIRTGQPARRHEDFRWSTLDSWSRRRRVVGKAEWTRGEANPRFVVTSLKPRECDARSLYERIYCARGDMENRVKECQLDLFAGRASAATMRANQLRLWFAAVAYVLLCALRRIGLAHTQFAEATSSPRPPAARYAWPSSRSARWSGSASAASKWPWPRRIRTKTSSPSPTPDWPPPRRPDDPDSASRHRPRQRRPARGDGAVRLQRVQSAGPHATMPRTPHRQRPAPTKPGPW